MALDSILVFKIHYAFDIEMRLRHVKLNKVKYLTSISRSVKIDYYL